MSWDEFKMWGAVGGIMVAVVLVCIGLAMLGSYVAYGDAGCAFAHCIRVVR